eukprot:528527-Prorocentrum_minimum.AAC.1
MPPPSIPLRTPSSCSQVSRAERRATAAEAARREAEEGQAAARRAVRTRCHFLDCCDQCCALWQQAFRLEPPWVRNTSQPTRRLRGW